MNENELNAVGKLNINWLSMICLTSLKKTYFIGNCGILDLAWFIKKHSKSFKNAKKVVFYMYLG